MDTPAVRNMNPGNLKNPSTGQFQSFSNPLEGKAALYNDLTAKMTGTSSTGLNGDSSVLDFAKVYAPKSDGNDPVTYAANIANKMGISPDDKIGTLIPRIDDFASAVASNEDPSVQYKQTSPIQAQSGYNPTPYSNPGQFDFTGTTPDTTQTDTQSENPGFIQSLVRGVANPFMRVGANVADIYKTLNGEQVDPNAQINYGDYLGSAKPIGQEGDLTQRVKDSLGVGASMASNLVLPEAAGGLKAATVGGRILKGAFTGAKAGAAGGGVYGLGSALQDNNGIGDTFAKTAAGAGTGLLTGGLLGGALGAPMAGKNFIKPSDATVYENRSQALQNVVQNNNKLRTLVQSGQNQGIDFIDELAKSNILKDSVDSNGTIDTFKPGGALDKMNEFMAPAEQVVKNNLERENVTLTPEELANQIKEEILKSTGLSDLAKKKALAQGQDTVSAMSEISGNKQGNIPLASVHQNKVDLYNEINKSFLNPSSHIIDKTVARALKKIVEKNSNIPVEELNKELAPRIAMMKFLKELNGKKVQGGRLGKYFAQTLGGVLGNTVGGPFGGIIGAEGAGAAHGALLKRSLQGEGILGKSPSIPMKHSGFMQDFINSGKQK